MANRGRRRGSRQSRGRAGGWLFACTAIAALQFAATGLASTSITTVAGGGTSTEDGVAALASALKTPAGVRPVASGFVLAEQGHYRVRRVAIADIATSDTGPITTIAGSGTPGNGQAVLDGSATAVSLSLPCCVASTANGDLLVADTLGGMVWRVVGSRIRTVAGTGAPTSCQPTPPAEIAAKSAALCFVVGVGASPAQDRFLVAEDGLPDQSRSGGARVYEVDTTGVLHIVAGGGCPNGNPAEGPLALCLSNPRGPLYTGNPAAPTEFVFADRGRHVVWKVSSTNPASATASLVAGSGRATDADLSTLGDGGPAGEATLSGPADLGLAPNGNLLIADRDNCRVRRVESLSAAAEISTVAGTTCGDGLAYPQGVAFSPSGILVSESVGGRVRLLQRTSLSEAPSGTVTSERASFAFGSVQPGPRFRCSLDGETPSACSSPTTYERLADGEHSFAVYDSTEPADPSPARATWVVDTTPPSPLALGAPAAGALDAKPRPRFEWQASSDETSGVARYELVIDGATYATVHPSECAAGVCSARPDADLGEGPHRWLVRALDRAGLARNSEERALGVGSDPVARLTVAPDPVLVGNPVGIDASESGDEGGSIARYEWDLDGNGFYELDSGARPFISRSFPIAGPVQVSVRVTDAVGRRAVASRSLRVNDRPGAPRLYGVSVDRGAAFTNSPNVTLNLFYPETTTGVVMSNDGGFMTAFGIDPAPKMRWRLASSGGERLPKTVYVKFLAGPFVTDTFSDDIILDETRPQVLTATARSARRPRAARSVRVRARDNLSGVTGVQLSVGRRAKRGRFRAYSPRSITVRGAGRVWVRVRDGAGNVSPWRAARQAVR